MLIDWFIQGKQTLVYTVDIRYILLYNNYAMEVRHKPIYRYTYIHISYSSKWTPYYITL